MALVKQLTIAALRSLYFCSISMKYPTIFCNYGAIRYHYNWNRSWGKYFGL